jgi:uncharacterized protein (TIGR02145 family)
MGAAADTPAVNNVESSESDLTIEDKPKGIFSSLASRMYSVLGTVLLIAFITNPGEGSHQFAVAKGGGFVPTIMMRDGLIPVIVALVITSKNYLVFSLTTVKSSNRIIGIGAFGCVYLFADVLPDFDDDDDDEDDDDERQTSVTPASVKKSSFTDKRDGKVYKTIEIGSQTWFAENLNYAAKSSMCYENKEANCAKYGRLYNWETALTACPAGTHLPADDEWETLVDNVGGTKIAGKKLKSTKGWKKFTGYSGNGTDNYGFSALPGGLGYSDVEFRFVGEDGNWWSETEEESTSAYYWNISRTSGLVNWYQRKKSDLRSVRCVVDGSSYAPAPVQQKNTETAQSAAPTQQNNTGVGETKRELDPRLITSDNENWFEGGIGCNIPCASTYTYFYANGTFKIVSVYPDRRPNTTTTGIWYTSNDTLFRYNDELGDMKGKYSITDEGYWRNSAGVIYEKVKH